MGMTFFVHDLLLLLLMLVPQFRSAAPFAAWIRVRVRAGVTATAEMYRFRDDLSEKLNDSVDLQTLNWIWIRLGETRPHGKRYTEQHEPSLRECFPPGTW